jgi:hypothetical protein
VEVCDEVEGLLGMVLEIDVLLDGSEVVAPMESSGRLNP